MAPWQHFQLCILNIWDLDPVFEKRDPDPVKNGRGLQHCTLHNSSVSLYVNPRILLIFFTVLHSEPWRRAPYSHHECALIRTREERSAEHADHRTKITQVLPQQALDDAHADAQLITPSGGSDESGQGAGRLLLLLELQAEAWLLLMHRRGRGRFGRLGPRALSHSAIKK